MIGVTTQLDFRVRFQAESEAIFISRLPRFDFNLVEPAFCEFRPKFENAFPVDAGHVSRTVGRLDILSCEQTSRVSC